MRLLGCSVPGYQLRERLTKLEDKENFTLEDLNVLYGEISAEQPGHVNSLRKGSVGANDVYYRVAGMAGHGADEIVHTIRIEEEVAFSNWINRNLKNDPDLKGLLPVDSDNGDLYKKVQDGLILCKLINLAQPNTIDERAINKKNLNKYSKLENLTLSLMSAQAIGCNIVNIDADDIIKGKPHLVLGMIWQIIRVGLFSHINLEHVPGMFRLLKEGETLDGLRRLTPEQILLRWANHHLANVSPSIMVVYLWLLL